MLQMHSLTAMFYLPSLGARLGLVSQRSIDSLTPRHVYTSLSGQMDQTVYHNNMVLVLDFWERMVNIQTGLRRLVQLSVDSDFTVVEPFLYQSRATPQFSFPEQFLTANLTPQPASLYFRTETLLHTNRYITHEDFRRRFRVNEPVHNARKTRFVLNAIVIFKWDMAHSDRRMSPHGYPFYWCDEELKKNGLVRRKGQGYALISNVLVQRAVCFSVKSTTSPARFYPVIFRRLFQFVRSGTQTVSTPCGNCVAIAFMNYRKHAFTGFVSDMNSLPFFQMSPPLDVGNFPRRLARKVQRRLLEGQRYVAVQIRTGKAYTLLAKKERRMMAAGMVFRKHEMFEHWLGDCIKAVTREVVHQRQALGEASVVYVASDMYNDGWRGGELCPMEVANLIKVAKKKLKKELGIVRYFEPWVYSIRQDLMGMAGLVDAAVSLDADRFIYSTPSNFGTWIHAQRAITGREVWSKQVQCGHKLEHIE